MMFFLNFFAILSSFLVVTSSSTVLSIIWLVAVFILVAFWLSFLTLTYVALTYVIVYIGAIAILFLFVVQLLDNRQDIDKVTDDVDSSYHENYINESSNFKNSFFLALIIGLFLSILIGEAIPFLGSELFVSNTQHSSGFEFVQQGLNKAYSQLFYNFQYFGEGIEEGTQVESFSLLNANQGLIFDSNKIGEISDFSLEDKIYTSNSPNSTGGSQVRNFGEWLYGPASIGLVIVSIILLIAMVGPIVICWSLT